MSFCVTTGHGQASLQGGSFKLSPGVFAGNCFHQRRPSASQPATQRAERATHRGGYIYHRVAGRPAEVRGGGGEKWGGGAERAADRGGYIYHRVAGRPAEVRGGGRSVGGGGTTL